MRKSDSIISKSNLFCTDLCRCRHLISINMYTKNQKNLIIVIICFHLWYEAQVKNILYMISKRCWSGWQYVLCCMQPGSERLCCSNWNRLQVLCLSVNQVRSKHAISVVNLIIYYQRLLCGLVLICHQKKASLSLLIHYLQSSVRKFTQNQFDVSVVYYKHLSRYLSE